MAANELWGKIVDYMRRIGNQISRNWPRKEIPPLKELESRTAAEVETRVATTPVPVMVRPNLTQETTSNPQPSLAALWSKSEKDPTLLTEFFRNRISEAISLKTEFRRGDVMPFLNFTNKRREFRISLFSGRAVDGYGKYDRGFVSVSIQRAGDGEAARFSIGLHTGLFLDKEGLDNTTYNGAQITANILKAVGEIEGVDNITLTTSRPSLEELVAGLPSRGYSLELHPDFEYANRKALLDNFEAVAQNNRMNSPEHPAYDTVRGFAKNIDKMTLQDIHAFHAPGDKVADPLIPVGAQSLSRLSQVVLKVRKVGDLTTPTAPS